MAKFNLPRTQDLSPQIQEMIPSQNDFNINNNSNLNKVIDEVIESGPMNKSVARNLFNKYGLTLNLIAENMRNLLTVGEESTRLKVLQDLLKIHGALEDQVESKSVSINFNFIPRNNEVDVDSISKIQVLIPRLNMLNE